MASLANNNTSLERDLQVFATAFGDYGIIACRTQAFVLPLTTPSTATVTLLPVPAPPSFVDLTNNIFTVTAPLWSDIGTYPLTFRVSSGALFTDYPITLWVNSNRFPYFDYSPED